MGRKDGRGRAKLTALATACSMCVAGPYASADETRPREPSGDAESASSQWRQRYDDARTDLLGGRLRSAESSFRTLASEATNDSDRGLALEMARLAGEYAERSEGQRPGVRGERDIRGSDELTLLYASALLYGVGSGTWFLLETQPDGALTATLPFAAIAEGIAAAGATIGLATGWVATSGMPRQLPVATSRPVHPSIAPSLLPVPGGITVGVGGALP
jgi:hypothetical protein